MMGYALYRENDRWCGYAVRATCDAPGCDERIDRGLAFKCESLSTNEDWGCRGFYCHRHMVMEMCRGCLADDGHAPGLPQTAVAVGLYLEPEDAHVEVQAHDSDSDEGLWRKAREKWEVGFA